VNYVPYGSARLDLRSLSKHLYVLKYITLWRVEVFICRLGTNCEGEDSMRKGGEGTYHEGNTEEDNNGHVVFITSNIYTDKVGNRTTRF
jgi:hypothetical protein